MKIKKLSKKLTLNKKTISNLSKIEMNTAHGGRPFYTWLTCDTDFDCTNPACCEYSFLCKPSIEVACF